MAGLTLAPRYPGTSSGSTRSAVSIASSSSSTPRPAASASSNQTLGGRPSGKRASASWPTVAPVARSTTGWNTIPSTSPARTSWTRARAAASTSGPASAPCRPDGSGTRTTPSHHLGCRSEERPSPFHGASTPWPADLSGPAGLARPATWANPIGLVWEHSHGGVDWRSGPHGRAAAPHVRRPGGPARRRQGVRAGRVRRGVRELAAGARGRVRPVRRHLGVHRARRPVGAGPGSVPGDHLGRAGPEDAQRPRPRAVAGGRHALGTRCRHRPGDHVGHRHARGAQRAGARRRDGGGRAVPRPGRRQVGPTASPR